MTITEVITGITIFTIVLAGIIILTLGGYRAYYYAFEQAQAISEARNGIEIMIEEIREARPGDDGSYIIEQADDYQFIFFGDIDNDGFTERVRYFIDGTDFKKGVINPTSLPVEYITDPENPLYSEAISILSKYVRNAPPIFRYFDGDFNKLSAPARLSETKLMTLYLIINVNPSQSPSDFILENSVQLRNLKMNL